MAILVKYNGTVSSLNSENGFDEDMISNALGCDTNNILYGTNCSVFIYVYKIDESVKKKNKNTLVSSVVGTTIYGDVIFLSGKELKGDIKDVYTNEDNSVFDGKQFNMAVVAALRSIVMELEENEDNKEVIYFDFDKVYDAYERGLEKVCEDTDNEYDDTEYAHKKTKKIVSESDLRVVMECCYNSLKSADEIDPNDFVLIHDTREIKLDPNKVDDTIGKILWYYEMREEYEKCAVLRDLKSKIKK